ncbi:MAG: hypothetical protein JHD16_10015 [Solirubrobacteraceae bacterium]|nr:hypothetical protein [Solirubrobacteraceae bacterium]
MDELDDDDRPAGGRRTAVILVAALVIALIAGLATWGLAGEQAPTVADGASGCEVRALAYTVTDDPEEFAIQKRFESEDNTVPAPGFYDRILEPVAALHAAAHAYVVVFVRPGARGDGVDRLRALEERAAATKAPVIVSQREQVPGFVALARGYELSCADDGAAQAAEVARFAAQLYGSVADPADPSTTPPAPVAVPNAPSPADPAS